MSLPKPYDLNELLAGRRFEEMTSNPMNSRPDDCQWFVNEIINGSLIAYYQKRDEFEVLIDGEQIDDP